MSETGSTAATRKPRKTQRGVVVSDKMDKTLTVKIEVSLFTLARRTAWCS